jgi:hypothetical protein
MGFGKIKLDKNDILFSKMIRERDGNKCIFCGRTSEQYSIQNSHYWGRGDKVHRFDPKNCDALCFICHNTHEGNKQGEYREFKLKQLGERLYNKMQQDHYQKTKKYGAYEKEILHSILKEQYKNREHLKTNWAVLW